MADRIAVTAAAARTVAGGLAAATNAVLSWPDGSPGGGRITTGDSRTLGVDRRDVRILGRQGLLVLAAARDALAAAGLGEDAGAVACTAALGVADADPEDLRRAVAASGGSDAPDEARFLEGAWRDVHPLWPLAMLPNVGLSVVCSRLGLRGETIVLTGGAEAGLAALIEAMGLVREHGRRVLVVAASDCLEGPALRRLALQRGAGAPPPGEGAIAMVVEDEGRARSRGARPVAVVSGAARCFRSTPADAASAAAEAAAGGREIDVALPAGLADSPAGVPEVLETAPRLGDLRAAAGLAAAALAVEVLVRRAEVLALLAVAASEEGCGAAVVVERP